VTFNCGYVEAKEDSCVGKGYDLITTSASCKAAATALNVTDKKVVLVPNMGGASDLPKGCYTGQTTAGAALRTLHFHESGESTVKHKLGASALCVRQPTVTAAASQPTSVSATQQSSTECCDAFSKIGDGVCEFINYTEGTNWKSFGTTATTMTLQKCADGCLVDPTCTGFEHEQKTVTAPITYNCT
jgi:hypothetical protein